MTVTAQKLLTSYFSHRDIAVFSLHLTEDVSGITSVTQASYMDTIPMFALITLYVVIVMYLESEITRKN